MAEEAGTPTEEVICRRYGEKKGIFVKTDVTVGTEVEALVQAAAKAGGRLDMSVLFAHSKALRQLFEIGTRLIRVF